MSAALFETLGAAEIILRNAFHYQLGERHTARGGSGPWYDSAKLDAKGHRDIQTAKAHATGFGRKKEIPGKVIAELSFGFWRYLVARRYQVVIWPALQKAFPNHPDGAHCPRGDIEDRMQRIHVLRNRIPHHEPVFRRDLAQDHGDLLTLVGWISSDGQRWVSNISRLEALISQRPIESPPGSRKG